MKTRVMLMVAMLALSAPVFATPNGCPPGHQKIGSCGGDNGSEGGDATAVGVGIGVGVGIASAEANAAALAASNSTSGAAVVGSGNSDVDVRNTANGGNATNSVGNVSGLGNRSFSPEASADSTNLNTNVNAPVAHGGTAIQGQQQGQQQGNVNVVGVQGSQQSQSIAEGAVQNTVTSDNTNTATGGQGGTAVSAAVVSEGAVQNSNDYSYTYKEVRQAPAIGQGSFAISGCGVAGNAGASTPGGAGFLGFGFTPQQCYDFMLAQAYQSIGEKKAVCDILKNSKAGKRQAKRGITLPECLPEVQEVKTVVVEVPKTVYVEVPPAKISE